MTTPKLTSLQRECYELPMVCFLLAIKFSDGCPPLLDHLCLSLAFEGIEADKRALAALESAVLAALQWRVDTVTVTHLLLQALQLLPAGQRDSWRASMSTHVNAFHAECMTTDFRASTAAAAIIGIVAHTAGLSEECLAPWLPHALTPPLDALGGAAEVSAAQRETLACMQEVRRALPPDAPHDGHAREASLSPPMGIKAFEKASAVVSTLCA